MLHRHYQYNVVNSLLNVFKVCPEHTEGCGTFAVWEIQRKLLELNPGAQSLTISRINHWR